MTLDELAPVGVSFSGPPLVWFGHSARHGSRDKRLWRKKRTDSAQHLAAVADKELRCPGAGESTNPTSKIHQRYNRRLHLVGETVNRAVRAMNAPSNSWDTPAVAVSRPYEACRTQHSRRERSPLAFAPARGYALARMPHSSGVPSRAARGSAGCKRGQPSTRRRWLAACGLRPVAAPRLSVQAESQELL